jgi:hypothetical protein
VKTINFCVVAFLTISNSCQNNDNTLKAKELELKERELELREKELNKNIKSNSTDTSIRTFDSQKAELSQNLTRYMYVIFRTDEPRVDNPNSDFISFSRKTFYYVTEINKIVDYDENKKFEIMDELQTDLKKKLHDQDNINSTFVSFQNNRRDEINKISLPQPAKIISREAKVFDNYKDASVSKMSSKHDQE